MRTLLSFEGYARSSRYLAGCTGQSVYLYKYKIKDGGEIVLTEEVMRFTGLTYAYHCLFSPDEKILAVRSGMGIAYIYSMETMTLQKKFRYGKDDQDHGFCFSHDGKKLYFIEHVRGEECMYSRLLSYDTEAYEKMTVEFADKRIELRDVAQCEKDGEFYLSGYMRTRDGFASIYFAAKLCGGEITDIRYLKNSALHYSEYESNVPGTLSSLFSGDEVCRGMYYDSISPLEHCALNVRFDEIRNAVNVIKVRSRNVPNRYVYVSEKVKDISKLRELIGETVETLASYGKDDPFEGISLEGLAVNLDAVLAVCKCFLEK